MPHQTTKLRLRLSDLDFNGNYRLATCERGDLGDEINRTGLSTLGQCVVFKALNMKKRPDWGASVCLPA